MASTSQTEDDEDLMKKIVFLLEKEVVTEHLQEIHKNVQKSQALMEFVKHDLPDTSVNAEYILEKYETFFWHRFWITDASQTALDLLKLRDTMAFKLTGGHISIHQEWMATRSNTWLNCIINYHQLHQSALQHETAATQHLFRVSFTSLITVPQQRLIIALYELAICCFEMRELVTLNNDSFGDKKNTDVLFWDNWETWKDYLLSADIKYRIICETLYYTMKTMFDFATSMNQRVNWARCGIGRLVQRIWQEKSDHRKPFGHFKERYHDLFAIDQRRFAKMFRFKDFDYMSSFMLHPQNTNVNAYYQRRQLVYEDSLKTIRDFITFEMSNTREVLSRASVPLIEYRAPATRTRCEPSWEEVARLFED